MSKNTVKVEARGDRGIVMTRGFDAPRALVWDAYTKPELLTRWLGVRNGWTFPVCEMDLRVGGKYRWVWRSAEGQDMGVSGVFTEIVAPEKLVTTEKFDDAWYDGEAVNEVTLTENGGKTTFVIVMRYDSRATRDAVLASPMKRGVEESYLQLDKVLATAM